MKFSHFLKATGIQALADIRPQLLGASALNLIIVPALWVFLGRTMSRNIPNLDVSAGHFLIAGSLVGMSTLVASQIASEVYNEFTAGVLLRVRTLPHGVKIWSAAKLATASAIILASQLLILIATIVFIPAFELTWARVALAVPFLLLVILAAAPLGFIVGAVTRSLWSYLIGVLALTGLLIISGIFFPLTVLPGWVQAFSQVFPVYHAGVVSRWIFIGSNENVLASVLVLAAWLIVGMMVAWKLVEVSFRKVSLGQVARAQQKMKTMMGM
ncbi:ABC transporter permease [Trueperella pecoris]|uniref:Transport permease protein n=1 Tax=Trueperella pecoris TaxID=2733571 RepID=A0A7M1QY24_9ACTO|nr:ABC transporter permease [Trueperella pecoris]QOR46773.1 ABC transporter permease [Trueperella pecoris]